MRGRGWPLAEKLSPYSDSRGYAVGASIGAEWSLNDNVERDFVFLNTNGFLCVPTLTDRRGAGIYGVKYGNTIIFGKKVFSHLLTGAYPPEQHDVYKIKPAPLGEVLADLIVQNT